MLSPKVEVTPTTVVPNPGPGVLPARGMTVSFDPMLSLPQVNDWFLSLDHLYFGQPWLIGLKRFPQMASQPMNFYFRPIKEGATFLIDLPADKQPEFSGGNVLKLNNVRIIPQYKTTISLK